MRRVAEERKSGVRKVKADEVYQLGPLTISRYGRFVEFKNEMTAEQMNTLKDSLPATNKEIVQQLEKEVLGLQKIITGYDPLELLWAAANECIPAFIRHRSESEFSHDEVLNLPALEYVQYLIARSRMTKKPKKLEEDEWGKIWLKTKQVLELTNSYLMTKSHKNNPPTAMELISFQMNQENLFVRVKRYPNFQRDYWKSALSPFDAELREIYGIGWEEIVEGLTRVEEFQRFGFAKQYQDAILAGAKAVNETRKQGFDLDTKNPDEIRAMQFAKTVQPLKAYYDDAKVKSMKALSPEAFEITELTGLPINLLSTLSVKPGEEILEKLTGDNHEDLSPLSGSVLHHKPFLEVNGKYYAFFHSGFEDRIAEIIEKDMFDKISNKARRSRLENKRSDYLEEETKDIFDKLLKPEKSFKNLYYKDPDTSQLTELDHLFISDDVLYIVEEKSGAMSESANRGAIDSLASNLGGLILEGQRQSVRAEKYISSAEEVTFYQEDGATELTKVRRGDFRKVVRVVVTREELGSIGANLSELSEIDDTLSITLPWHVSIGDLRVIAELFNGKPGEFSLFMEYRLEAGATEALSQRDEIDHVALYHKYNQYGGNPFGGADRLTYDGSYTQDIDYYFADKLAGKKPKVPAQKIDPTLKQLVEALESSNLPHRHEAVKSVLFLDTSTRKKLAQMMNKLKGGAEVGRQRSSRIPFSDVNFGQTITFAQGTNFDTELRHSAGQMTLSECERWIVIQLGLKPFEVKNIVIVQKGDFSDEVIREEIELIDKKMESLIVHTRIKPNESCPCASGKQFKDCHGKAK